jgi:hypothetical protein
LVSLLQLVLESASANQIARSISPGVQSGGVSSAPDDHFTAGRDCRVKASRRRRVGGAGGCPTVRAWIVFAAGVEIIDAIPSTPDDHFTASPHCRVDRPGTRRVGRASGCPRIINASVWDGRYDGRGITTSHCRHSLSFLVFRAPSAGAQRFLITVVDFS